MLRCPLGFLLDPAAALRLTNRQKRHTHGAVTSRRPQGSGSVEQDGAGRGHRGPPPAQFSPMRRAHNETRTAPCMPAQAALEPPLITDPCGPATTACVWCLHFFCFMAPRHQPALTTAQHVHPGSCNVDTAVAGVGRRLPCSYWPHGLHGRAWAVAVGRGRARAVAIANPGAGVCWRTPGGSGHCQQGHRPPGHRPLATLKAPAMKQATKQAARAPVCV